MVPQVVPPVAQQHQTLVVAVAAHQVLVQQRVAMGVLVL
jgi:hypothetical protein